MWRFGCFLTLTLSGLSAAQAQTPPDVAGNNFAHEHMMCSAYYAIMSECVKTRPDIPGTDELVEQTSKIAETLFQRGSLFGVAAGVSAKASHARFEIAIGEMMNEMDKSCSNVAVLNVKHGEPCKFLAEHPEDRLKQLLPN